MVATGERALGKDRGGADIGKDVLNVLGGMTEQQRTMAPAPTVWVWGMAADGFATYKNELNVSLSGTPTPSLLFSIYRSISVQELLPQLKRT